MGYRVLAHNILTVEKYDNTFLCKQPLQSDCYVAPSSRMRQQVRV